MNGPSALSRSARAAVRTQRATPARTTTGATTTTTTTRPTAATAGTARHAFVCSQCRGIQISAVPSTDSPRAGGDAFGVGARDVSDARFEVIGSPYSMLSASLSASQKLYTRRGTLVALAGNPEHAQSTLSVLNPLARAPFGVPFLYQRISATSPVTALISTKSSSTSFTVLRLDGRTDWVVAQRAALLAWTGHTLRLAPRVQRGLSVAHWGSTELTGRGLAALAAPGQVYRLDLAEGEDLVAHPGSVVAYSVARHAPRPFRFRSSSLSMGLRLQVPSLTSRLPEVEALTRLRETGAYKWLVRALHGLRTVMRRTIWGDRLFMQFRGPMTILMSSRGVRVAESLSDAQVNEIADAPAGAAQAALQKQAPATATTKEQKGGENIEIVTIKETIKEGNKRDGKVSFEDVKQLKEKL